MADRIVPFSPSSTASSQPVFGPACVAPFSRRAQTTTVAPPPLPASMLADLQTVLAADQPIVRMVLEQFIRNLAARLRGTTVGGAR